VATLVYFSRFDFLIPATVRARATSRPEIGIDPGSFHMHPNEPAPPARWTGPACPGAGQIRHLPSCSPLCGPYASSESFLFQFQYGSQLRISSMRFLFDGADGGCGG